VSSRLPPSTQECSYSTPDLSGLFLRHSWLSMLFSA
jgi:hypothetical protein